MIIGADVGGTFTDLVAIHNGVLTTYKTSTTPDQSEGVADGMDVLSKGSDVDSLVHGTTVATNALLERSGARTALITDEGFEDVIEIARQDRPSLYDSFVDRSPALVERDARFGVQDASVPVDLSGFEAIAVSMVNGHTDPQQERAVAEAVHQSHPDIAVSVSSVVAPEYREFERTSTTVLNAYLSPVTSRYLDALEEKVVGGDRAAAISVMRSSGGLMSVAQSSQLPSAVLLSGPAGGVVAASAIAASLGMSEVISFDMGGTSTDVCRIGTDGADVSYERSIDGYSCRMPSVGIHTVGAGGGSTAWIDPGGALRVGPQSAGAHPGPVAYGRGGNVPTVTDANVVLGRIDADLRLGGTVSIDADAARAAIAELGARIGLDPSETALGIVRIAEDHMARAVRTVTVEQGFDPSSAYLMAFGGAGGLHASAVARSLGMRGVVVPRHAGVLSALGLILAPPRSDLVAAVHLAGEDLTEATAAAKKLSSAAAEQLEAAGVDPVRTRVWLDVRYVGQSHEIAVPWDVGMDYRAVVSRFNDLHSQRNGFARPNDPIEVVAVRCTSFGEPPTALSAPTTAAGGEEGHVERSVTDNGGNVRSARVIQRDALGADTEIDGPAIIEEAEATTYIDHADLLRVLPDGSLEVSW